MGIVGLGIGVAGLSVRLDGGGIETSVGVVRGVRIVGVGKTGSHAARNNDQSKTNFAKRMELDWLKHKLIPRFIR